MPAKQFKGDDYTNFNNIFYLDNTYGKTIELLIGYVVVEVDNKPFYRHPHAFCMSS
jgi:hypothetical protein